MLQKWIKKGGKKDVAMWISFVSMGFNMILTVMKLAAGIMAGSDALISDAIHSASDVVATLIVIIGIVLSSKEADREHPYGHERLECIAAMILGGIVFMTGAGIGHEGFDHTAGRGQRNYRITYPVIWFQNLCRRGNTSRRGNQS